MPTAVLPRIDRDRHGYLRRQSDWTPALALEIAREEKLVLTDSHQEILGLLRDFYTEFGITPATRVFVRRVASQLGADKGNSIYLMKLFPGGAVKQGCKIAGLPRPTQCF